MEGEACRRQGLQAEYAHISRWKRPRRRVQTTGGDVSAKRTRLAAVVDRLPRQRCSGELQPRPDEDLDRLARVRELALVASVRHSRAASGRKMGQSGDLPGAG